MPLKHQAQLERLGCNLERFTERENRDAHCWTFEDIADARNFIPRAIAVGRDECTAWGLSFFETAEQAEERLLYITRDKERLFKKLGSHIARGILDTADGISEDCNSYGHFNHFENEGVDFRQNFVVIIKVA